MAAGDADSVIARAAVDEVVQAGADLVVPGVAEDPVRIGIPVLDGDRVIAVAAVDLVGSVVAKDRVVAAKPVNDVIAIAARQEILPGIAFQDVIVTRAQQALDVDQAIAERIAPRARTGCQRHADAARGVGIAGVV